MDTIIAMPIDAPLGDAQLYRLMTWLSPSFPVGAFTYSHGIEFAVEDGLVKDHEALAAWIGAIVEKGAGRIDAMMFAAAHRAAADGDDTALDRAVERAHATRASHETALEATAQGVAFVETVRRVWPDGRIERWRERMAAMARQPTLAVAVGTVAGFMGLPAPLALVGYLQSFAANLVSAGVRLVPLGQTDGQRVMALLEPVIVAAAARAPEIPLADLGGAAFMVDWTSIRHETQYTRLFRS